MEISDRRPHPMNLGSGNWEAKFLSESSKLIEPARLFEAGRLFCLGRRPAPSAWPKTRLLKYKSIGNLWQPDEEGHPPHSQALPDFRFPFSSTLCVFPDRRGAHRSCHIGTAEPGFCQSSRNTSAGVAEVAQECTTVGDARNGLRG